MPLLAVLTAVIGGRVDLVVHLIQREHWQAAGAAPRALRLVDLPNQHLAAFVTSRRNLRLAFVRKPSAAPARGNGAAHHKTVHVLATVGDLASKLPRCPPPAVSGSSVPSASTAPCQEQKSLHRCMTAQVLLVTQTAFHIVWTSSGCIRSCINTCSKVSKFSTCKLYKYASVQFCRSKDQGGSPCTAGRGPGAANGRA